MNRRELLGLGVGAGVLAFNRAGGGALPVAPCFRTRRVVSVMLYGDVTPNVPWEIVNDGTLFTNDREETTHLHGYLASEIVTGRRSRSQRPEYPTWHEYVRKRTGGRAAEHWILQPVAYAGAWTWDVKNFSTHPDYGVRFGATSLTMSKCFAETEGLTPGAIVERNLDPGLDHSEQERRRIEAWIEDVVATKRHLRPGPLGLAFDVLSAFEPRMLTLQILGCGTPELIGKLWRHIQDDARFRATTALLIRGGSWTVALGPDFRNGHVVSERFSSRDIAPTLAYLMTGVPAEHATGRVRTQLFPDRYRMPPYDRTLGYT